MGLNAKYKSSYNKNGGSRRNKIFTTFRICLLVIILVITLIVVSVWGTNKARPIITSNSVIKEQKNKKVEQVQEQDVFLQQNHTNNNIKEQQKLNVSQEQLSVKQIFSKQYLQQYNAVGLNLRYKAIKKQFTPYKGDTKEQIRQILRDYATDDGYIIMTVGNYYYAQEGFIKNWVRNLLQQNITNFFVGAYDNKTFEYLQDNNVASVQLTDQLPSSHFGWFNDFAHFWSQGIFKLESGQYIAELGYQQVHSELDVVWFKDPIQYMREHSDIDFMHQSDNLFTTVEDDGFESSNGEYINPGMLMMRNSCLPLIKKWRNVLQENHKQKKGQLWDQGVLQELAHVGPRIALGDRKFKLFEESIGTSLVCACLNVAIFAGGHTHFIQNLADIRGYRLFAIHMTFIYAGQLGKRHRLREGQLWIDDEDYYTPKNTKGFISFDFNLPRELIIQAIPSEPGTGFRNFQRHFDLIHYQYRQVRTAMALATLFNRTLVMDQFWSVSDQIWYAHNGMPYGLINMSLPIHAPLDHVMDIESLYNRTLDEKVFGPHINFREHNFLKNPRVPIKYTNSKVNVYQCESVKCQINDPVRHTKFIPGLSEAQWVHVMEDYENVSLWHFKNLKGKVFQGFKDPQRQNQFLKRVAQYSGRFCCAYGAPDPNDAYYDMQHDIVPHTDKWGRVFDNQWKILNGWLRQKDVDTVNQQWEQKLKEMERKQQEEDNKQKQGDKRVLI